VEAYLSNLPWQSGLLLSDGEMTVDGPYIIQLALRVLHILSAIILVGGLFYIRSILSPAGGSSPDDMNRACFAGRRAVWAKWVGIASAFLLVSGFYNFIAIHNQAKASGVKLPPTYQILFGVKFLLAMLVIFIASILAGKTDTAERFRGQMRRWLNIGWLAAMAIVIIAAMLRTFH
jgi:putative copper export protein